MIRILSGYHQQRENYGDADIEGIIEDELDTYRVKPRQVINIESKFINKDEDGLVYIFEYKIWYKD